MPDSAPGAPDGGLKPHVCLFPVQPPAGSFLSPGACACGNTYVPQPPVVCLCGSTRYYNEFQQANYDLTMHGVIVLSVGFYPHAAAAHGHGEGVGHDSAQKTALDELHKRKIDLADEVLIVSDASGYFGESTAGEIAYAVAHGKPVRFTEPAAQARALDAGLTTAKRPPFHQAETGVAS